MSPDRLLPPDKLRILAVEDDECTRILLRHALKDFCDPTVVGSEADALTAIEAHPFDVFLLDINLRAEDTARLRPERSGVKLLREIRDRARVGGVMSNDSMSNHPAGIHTDEVPVVAVTAYALPGDREWLLEKGFSGYVGKPFTREELRDAVFEVLSASGAPANA
jgi:CheY-like chemotaxis protein